MFGEQPLSSLARDLLAQERGRHEGEALKSRAVARARAALERERPSGIGIRAFGSGPLGTRSRRASRTLPLIAAASCAAGLAAAGANLRRGRAPEEALEPRAASPATAGTEDGTRSLSVKQYAAELLLLEPSRRSLSRGDYAGALASLGQHGRVFPDGQLSQEREALRVSALWSLGQKPAALAAASAFRKRYPRSALLSWLKDQGAQTP